MSRFFEKIKTFFNFLSQLLSPQEWTITIVTFLLSGMIISSIFWLDVENNPDEVTSYDTIGLNIYVHTSNEPVRTLFPFHSAYLVKYEKIYPLEQRQQVYEILNEEVPHLHKISDRNYRFYRDDAQPELGNMVTIRDVNEAYGSGAWLEVDDYLYQIIKIGKQLTILTNSNYNFFVGRLSDYWNELISDGTYPYEYENYDPYFNPSEQAIVTLLQSYIPKTSEEINATLELKEDNGYFVRFNTFNNAPLGELQITLGGIAKGFANDVVSARLIENRLTHGYISGGQSSNSALGSRYNNKPWTWYMNSPRNTGSEFAYELKRAGAFNLSTSGGYNGVPIMIDGEVVWRHHIIDPWTGFPSREQLHVSVMSSDVSSAELDALSTAIMNLTREEAMVVRDYYQNLGFEFEIAWIDLATEASLNVYYTSGYEAYLTKYPENTYSLVE